MQQNEKRSAGVQGKPTSDRAFSDRAEATKSRGISNGGGQRADQTSNRDNERKVANKRRSIL
ncbi:hypothetical protein FRZ54_17135 [Mucilaginibacter ginsenosidivorans]|uniref:Uncharacterized protein n=1 Tax=Mucilaginibacter ginsenosidivorans TaxID=398053 RepID=A0A5B8UYM6_9SPHI|nr:hypothetical protein FRZ54_17135 [Mucilaginibacter ginsenosidivorans]